MNLKRFVCCLVTGSFLFGQSALPVRTLSAAAVLAADSYAGFSWRQEDDTIYIEGEGEMPDDITEHFPWSWRFETKRIDENGNIIIENPADTHSVKKLVVGEGITHIAESAFFGLNDLESVSLPDSLRSIGANAFSDAYELASVTLPEHLERIEGSAFERSGLRTVTLPDSVVYIGSGAFSDCADLTEVHLPAHLDYLGDQVFAHSVKLTEVEFPQELGEVGTKLFEDCTAWDDLNADKECVIVGDGILIRYQGEGGKVVLPEGIKRIIGGAFYMRKQSDLAYGYNYDIPREDIDTLIMPESLERLESNAFEDIHSLHSVYLPDSLDYIGERCFYDCIELTELRLPLHLNHLGERAFPESPWLSKYGDFVIIGEKLLYRYKGDKKIVHIPEGVETICTEAFRQYDETVVVYCPDSLRTIESGALQGSSLTELHLNEGLTSIETGAIYTNRYLTSLRIPESVTELSDYALVFDPTHPTIIGAADSAAEQFAMKNQCPFSETDLPEKQLSGVDMTLDLDTDVWKFDNSGKYFNRTYYLTDRDREAILSHQGSKELPFAKSWNGACFGLSLTVILAKNGLLDLPALLPGIESPADAAPTEDVQSLINYHHALQYQRDYQQYNIFDTSAHKFYRLTQLAANVKNGESPFIITYKTENFSHAVVGYGLEYGIWNWGDKEYRAKVLIWDPNYTEEPLEECNLFFDPETFAYCIPQYDLYVTDLNGTYGIMKVVNDLSVLNQFPYAEFPQGDLSGDGAVTVADLVLMQRYLLGDECLRNAQMLRGDLNADDRLNAVDFTLLKQFIMQAAASAAE